MIVAGYSWMRRLPTPTLVVGVGSLLLLFLAPAVPARAASPVIRRLTAISGTVTMQFDTIVLPPGMVATNLPGGIIALIATNLSTGESGGGGGGAGGTNTIAAVLQASDANFTNGDAAGFGLFDLGTLSVNNQGTIQGMVFGDSVGGHGGNPDVIEIGTQFDPAFAGANSDVAIGAGAVSVNGVVIGSDQRTNVLLIAGSPGKIVWSVDGGLPCFYVGQTTLEPTNCTQCAIVNADVNQAVGRSLFIAAHSDSAATIFLDSSAAIASGYVGANSSAAIAGGWIDQGADYSVALAGGFVGQNSMDSVAIGAVRVPANTPDVFLFGGLYYDRGTNSPGTTVIDSDAMTAAINASIPSSVALLPTNGVQIIDLGGGTNAIEVATNAPCDGCTLHWNAATGSGYWQ